MVWFEWDEAKAKTNERKHGVRFENAIRVFGDPYAVTEPDRVEGDELRWQTIGMAGGIAPLLVVHTVQQDEGPDEIFRIISARKAARKEVKRYDENREESIS
jgi:uncharacterized DUF497 family protein